MTDIIEKLPEVFIRQMKWLWMRLHLDNSILYIRKELDYVINVEYYYLADISYRYPDIRPCFPRNLISIKKQ